MRRRQSLVVTAVLLFAAFAGAPSTHGAVRLELRKPAGAVRHEATMKFDWTASGDAVDGWIIRIMTAGPERQQLWSSARLDGAKRSLTTAVPFAAPPSGQLVWVLQAYRGNRNVASAAKLFSFDGQSPLTAFIGWLEQISELRAGPSVLYAPHGRIPAAREVEFVWTDEETPHHFVIRVLEERLTADDLEPREIWRSGEIAGTARTFRASLPLADSATSRYTWKLEVYTEPGELANRSESQSFAIRTQAEEAAATERERAFAAWAGAAGGQRHLLLLRAEVAAAAEDFSDARRQLARFVALTDDRHLTFKALTTLVAQELRKTAEARARLVEEFHASGAEPADAPLLARIAEADLMLLDYDAALAAYRAILAGTPPDQRQQWQDRIAQLTREQELRLAGRSR